MQELTEAQANPEVVLNENFETLEHQSVYGKRQPTTTGLTWGYYGGRWGGAAIADGTLSLSASSTNYVVVLRSSGAISVSATNTNWNNTTDYARVYLITTSASAVSTVQDHRVGPYGVHGQSSVAGGSVDADDVTYTPTTLSDWDGGVDPGDVEQALDQLAERVTDLEAGGAGDEHYEVDGTPASDDTWGGRGITGVNAGATIAQWEAVYMGSGGEWLLADATDDTAAPMRGLAAAAGTDNNPMTVVTEGVIRNDAWNWTIGGMLYLSTTAGGLTQTAPSSAGEIVQQVGFAITADVIYLNVGAATYIEVA